MLMYLSVPTNKMKEGLPYRLIQHKEMWPSGQPFLDCLSLWTNLLRYIPRSSILTKRYLSKNYGGTITMIQSENASPQKASQKMEENSKDHLFNSLLNQS